MVGAMKWVVRLEAVFEDGRASVITEIGEVERSDLETLPGTAFGLTLAEGKTLFAQLQSAICQDQVHAAARLDRVCRGCGTQRPHHDTRTRTVQSLFGKIVVDAPRFRACRCGLLHDPKRSRLHALIPGRTTAEFDNIAAELGARHSFRDAAHILDLFVPARTQHNHATVRLRLAAVSDQIAARDQKLPHRLARSTGEPRSVFIDGTFVRALPFYQTRHFEVVMGRIDAKGQKSRHFATMPHMSAARCDIVRAVLRSQGWLPKQDITVFSDGDFSLVKIVRRASHATLTHILDWFHVSIRIQHLRQCCGSLVGSNQSGEVEFRFLTEDMNGLRSATLVRSHETGADIPAQRETAIVPDCKQRVFAGRCEKSPALDKNGRGIRQLSRLQPIGDAQLCRALMCRSPGLKFTGGIDHQFSGEPKNEQAPPDALVADWRAAGSSGQGRNY